MISQFDWKFLITGTELVVSHYKGFTIISQYIYPQHWAIYLTYKRTTDMHVLAENCTSNRNKHGIIFKLIEYRSKCLIIVNIS